MKEKPQKASKSSKKGKEKAEPIKEVELTPKQLKEKRREEARAKAAETRKIVTAGTGQWTGKLPAQLLNEHAQKMKWERVEYPVKCFGKEPNQEWVASVILARRNPKTKEIEKVRFDPPPDRIAKQPTQVEARNLAATYGMHRVLSHRNMKMMLPPLHRDLWIQFDEDKAAAKEHEKYKWSEDPWQALKDRDEARQKLEQQRKERAERREHDRIAQEAQKEHVVESTHSDQTDNGSKEEDQNKQKTKRVRFNNTLTMSRRTRSIIESIVRSNNGFRFSHHNALDRKKHPDKYAQLKQMLEKLGFYRAFVEEALEYTCTLSSALAWLLIHVPEDDVPKMFMPSDIGFTARISANMAIENIAAQLQGFGYSEEVARATAEETNGSLANSVIKLTNSFLHSNSPAAQSAQGDAPAAAEADAITTDDQGVWSEELESLGAMLEEKQLTINEDQQSCAITLKAANVQIIFYKSPQYPETIPGIAVRPLKSSKLSKVVQLEATRRAAIYAHSSLLGDFMLMTLYQWLEDNFQSIATTPVKLARISTAVFGVDEDLKVDTDTSASISARRGRKRKNFDPKAVVEAAKKRMETPEGKAMLESRATLPAWQKRDEITEIVRKNQVVLVTGETGSGKSTQVIQFILDAFPSAQLVCTQPRRISAIGVAQRVADERLVKIGDQVGYVIRGEAKVSDQTQIRFLTSGVLLRMLQGSSIEDSGTIDLDGITHILVDEVHERSLDGDFLLILLKKLLKKAPHIKIILMSATVDPKKFVEYFKPVPVGYAHITGRTFPVSQHFLDDAIRLSNYKPRSFRAESEPTGDGNSGDDNGTVDSIGKIIGAIRADNPGRVDYELVVSVVEYIHKDLLKKGDSQGSILIFMSGAAEIDQVLRAVMATSVGKSLWALPLHAALPPVEQRKVFSKAPRGLRKVVASTNVAETSITISDVVAVIDTGRVKETVYDPEANVTRLVDTWVSQASATQRMGRAGRVRPGTCFKLYTENVQTQKMPERPLPEILRSPLENLYLNVKYMGAQNVEKFLSEAIDPPKATALDTARQNLVAYGALDPIDGSLTPLGRHISKIPTDPRTAKLLVLGAMMGCLSKSLTIAAIMSVGKLPFVINKNDEEGKLKAKELFEASNGDLLAAVRAYDLYRRGEIGREDVSPGVCRDIQSTRRQLLSSLVQTGFIESTAMNGGKEDLSIDYTKYDEDLTTVRAVLAAALQPNIVEAVFPQQKYTSTSAGAIQKDGVDDSRQIKFINNNGERVFVHPRSLLFGATEFASASRYLSYASDVMTSKHFITDVTPLSNYGLILFASRIGVDPLGNGLIIDKWTGLKCWPRAGILLQFLQQLFSSLLETKFKNPKVHVIEHPVIQLVHDLIESEGKPKGVGLVA